MGFSDKMSLIAARKFRGDLNRSANWLSNQNNAKSLPSSQSVPSNNHQNHAMNNRFRAHQNTQNQNDNDEKHQNINTQHNDDEVLLKS